MHALPGIDATLNRRGFLKTVGGGVTAAALLLTPQEQAKAQALDEKSKLNRIASWPIPPPIRATLLPAEVAGVVARARRAAASRARI